MGLSLQLNVGIECVDKLHCTALFKELVRFSMTETTVRQNCGMKMYLTCLHNVAKLAFRLN